jgi:TonB dependent receptor
MAGHPALPEYFDELVAPTQVLQSLAPRADDAQLSLLKKIESDDLRITGFVASRDGVATPDYRVYVGVRYKSDLGSLAQLTSRAFYGSGTFDGVDPNGSGLPEDVRNGGSLPGEWLGADWKVESHAFTGHTLSAGVEYRQELPVTLLPVHDLLGSAALGEAMQPERKIGLVTNNQVALSSDLALNVRVRYDEGTSAADNAVAPRAELIYKPAPSASVSLAAYRYSAEGQLASTAPTPIGLPQAPSTQIDTSGFELGMERSAAGGTRSRVSYAWQETADGLTGAATGSLGQHLATMSLDIPILPKRLSTSIEVQYIDFVGALVADRDRDYVIGNLTLASGTLSRDTRVTLGMRNLFDVKETNSGAQLLSFIPPDGRSVRLDVTRTL